MAASVAGARSWKPALRRSSVCFAGKPPLRFDTVIPLGGYHEGLRDAVLRMKRPADDSLSLAIGRLLVERRREQLAGDRGGPDCADPHVLGAPASSGQEQPRRDRALSGEIAGDSVRHGVLIRRRNTPPQAGLAPSRRFQNVRGAFRVRRPEAVKNARVLLVDDVLTTGATCSEAAKMLKQAGAAMVAVAVVARAQGVLVSRRRK